MRDSEASQNDRYVAFELLKNAVIAAEGVFPLCQDTGSAIVIGKKGQAVWTFKGDEDALSRGIYQAYVEQPYRYSQMAALTMYDEINTRCNLPAQIDICATHGSAYEFLFLAKGGGSANKTFLYQETRSLLSRERLVEFLADKIRSLGTAACPPYHLACVIGGTSAEANLKTVKLASAHYLDALPAQGNEGGRAFRDLDMEKILLDRCQDLGYGAQFGGKYFCLDVRVIRLSRHGASCPVGIGVSCNADRNIRAKITREGIFLERLETDPTRFLPQPIWTENDAVRIDLDQPMDKIRAALSRCSVSTRLMLTGPLIIARDIAHARIGKRLEQGEDLPWYFKDHIIFYAGPAKTPQGYTCGSLGPTTAARMDPYVPLFQRHKGSLIMLAKGNRSVVVKEACKRYGGFYLGAIGGPAARLGKDCITAMELVDFPELGMEAVYRASVKNFPAFLITDDKGNDFYDDLPK
jgi:fumarate hydratase class I